MEITDTLTETLAQPAASLPASPVRRGWLKGLGAVLGGLLLSRVAKARPASPQQVLGVQPFVGEIQLFPFGFAPRGWMQCNGQLLPINQNQALFSLLGTTYGGNGQTNFALPDMRGRIPCGMGSGFTLGQPGGSESVTLTTAQLPAHTHGYQVSSAAATSNTPVGTVAAVPSASTDLNGEAVNLLAYASTANTAAAPAAITTTGSASPTPVNILAPYETLNFCIAVEGLFPTRN